jgi:tetratricopeptide (TPR) repeat protein/tRNA A-37 threonylcarbamoyl transferase component Bud32
MTLERWHQVKELFDSALQCEPDQRSIFLSRACGEDASLRREVESLIASHEKDGSFIDSPAYQAAAEMLASDLELKAGQTIGHYEILSTLGKGGMGEVYLARDTRLDRRVALKFLPPHSTRDEDKLRRFEQEARAASALNHPNILTIYEIGEVDGRRFIATEFVDGETLRRPIEAGPLKVSEALNIAEQVASALAEAHAVGVIHRDVKPENIMLRRDGFVKVLDFGLAKLTEPKETGPEDLTRALVKTGSGIVMGTVTYMSPEQARGLTIDARTDIWSLGVVLHEMIAGQSPFASPTMSDVIAAILRSEPVPLGQYEVPAELERIVSKALQKEREGRYQTTRELLADLKRFRQRLEIQAEMERAGAVATLEFARLPTNREPPLFVGREAEMKRLEECLRDAFNGSGRLVFLTGEPGIGKTALADELLLRTRQPASLIVCRGRCVEQYGTGEAYLPFLDALGALLAGPSRERVMSALRTYAPTWCLQFPAAFASSGALEQLQLETIGATKERMLREMGDALGALAASSPLILLLEDLHWADPSSADLLNHLCQRLEGQRLLIVGTFRPEDLERSDHPLKTYRLEMLAHKLCEEIALGLLSEEQVASYLDARFAPNDFPRELCALIQGKTEGHPLFATSLAQFLAECGDIARVNEHWTLTRPVAEMNVEAPESVRSMIRKKIEALDEEDRRALQYASIEGEEFLSTVLAQLLGVEELEVEERLARLDKVHRLIETRSEEELPDGALATRYRFAHALYQNFLYDELVSKRRVLLHRQAGGRLLRHYGEEAPRIAAQLAMHFERGRDYGRAIEYLIHAGDNATQRYANAEAEGRYSRALRWVEKLPAEEQAGRYVSLHQKRGTVNHALSRFDRAVDDFTQMLDQAHALGSPALVGAALNALASALFFAHRLDEMAARAAEALGVAEASGNEALRIEALTLIAQRHYGLGTLAEARALLDESIRVARALNHKPTLLGGLAWRGSVHFFQSEYERAEEMLSEALSLSSELRNGFMVLFCLFFLGLTRGNLGRMAEALATLNEAIELGRRNGERYQTLKVPNSIGWIHRELGDLDHAIDHDRAGVEIARQHQLLEAEINSVINLGYDYTHQGEREKSPPAFREAEAMLERDEWCRWRFNLRLQAGQAEYWLAQGNPEQAKEYAQRLLENASHYEARKYIAVAHKLLAEVAIACGDLKAGETQLNAALDQLREFPAPLVAWKIYAALGRLRLQMGESALAREAFAQAAKIVEQIAANVSDENLQATFLNSALVREVLEATHVLYH